jgi:hypothetical protein
MSKDSQLSKNGDYTDLDDKELATTLAASGYFDDSKKSQAMTKVLAGREMGFGPVTSLKNIHFVDGGIELGGQLIASKIRQSNKYDYKIMSHTDEECEIAIVAGHGHPHFEPDEVMGTTKWDLQRAKKAGLTSKSNWKNYTRNMLFNRAISDARRFHCPDVMETGPYTPGEIPSNGSEQRAKKNAESQQVQDADFEVEDESEGEEEEEGRDEAKPSEDQQPYDETPPPTDAALELMQEQDFQDSEVDGTGKNGRITKSDVQEVIEEQQDTDDQSSGGDLDMNDVLEQCGDLIDDTPAKIPHISNTMTEIGITQDNIDRLVAYLNEVSMGDREYNVKNDIIQGIGDLS